MISTEDLTNISNRSSNVTAVLKHDSKGSITYLTEQKLNNGNVLSNLEAQNLHKSNDNLNRWNLPTPRQSDVSIANSQNLGVGSGTPFNRPSSNSAPIKGNYTVSYFEESSLGSGSGEGEKGLKNVSSTGTLV